MAVSYNPLFSFPPWVDAVDRVEAGGDNGFNVRFQALEREFDALAEVIEQVSNELERLSEQLDALSALALPEAWRRVGTPGQPDFQSGWSNFDPGNDRPASFYRDPWGVVHLQGVVKGGGLGVPMFTLPTGYRPDHPGADKNSHFPVTTGGVFGWVLVGADGTVRLNDGDVNWVDLGSIDFRGA